MQVCTICKKNLPEKSFSSDSKAGGRMKQCKDCCAENGIELPKMRGKYHGGQRDNAGRKRKWDEATVTCAFRIPASRKAELEKLVSDWMESIKPS